MHFLAVQTYHHMTIQEEAASLQQQIEDLQALLKSSLIAAAVDRETYTDCPQWQHAQKLFEQHMLCILKADIGDIITQNNAVSDMQYQHISGS
jgi:hypothetical protein